MGAEIERETSFGSTTDEEDYDWERLAKEERGIFAPQNIFNQPDYIPKNEFVKGHIVMALDKHWRVDKFYFIAQIDKIYKCFVRVNFIEVNRTFWTVCDSDLITPFNEKMLRRHPDNSKTDKAFTKWLTKFMSDNSSKIAPANIINKRAIYGPITNQFTPGMIFAYLDEVGFNGKLSPAIVTKTNPTNDNITVVLADRFKAEIEIRHNDRKLFPIEFAKMAKIPIRSGGRWKVNNKGQLLCKTSLIRKPPRAKVGKEKRKRGRPKKKDVEEKRPRLEDDISYGSFRTRNSTNINTSSEREESDTSFYPKTSTPIDQMEPQTKRRTFVGSLEGSSESNSPFESFDYGTGNIFNDSVTSSFTFTKKTQNAQPLITTDISNRSQTITNISAQSQATTKRCSAAGERIEKQKIQSHSLHHQNNSVNIPTICEEPPTQDIITFEEPKTYTSLMEEIQETWLYSRQGSDNPLAAMLLDSCNQSCVARVSSVAISGPLLDRNLLLREVATLPPINYKMQFYNIIVALTKSATKGQSVFDKFLYNVRGNEDYFTIYNKLNTGLILSKRFPSPKTFLFACGWLKFFLKQVEADEELITLHQLP